MDPVGTHLTIYVNEVTRFGEQFGPIMVKAAILLVVVLFFTKYLGRLLSVALIKIGVPERRATFSVTVLHILVLLVAALMVLNALGFPGMLLFRIIVVILLLGISTYIIAKPYIPQLPFKKGQTIQFGSMFGKVENITFMHTTLRTFDGKIIFVPNHKILNDQVTNMGIRPNRRVDIELFIPYDADRKKLQKEIGELLNADERVLEKPAAKLVISKFTPDYILMKARIWVEKKHVLTGRWAFNEMIIDKMDELGIKMAAPRVNVSQGSAQAVRPAEQPPSPPEIET